MIWRLLPVAGRFLLSRWKATAAVGVLALLTALWAWDRAGQREAGREEVRHAIEEAKRDFAKRRKKAEQEAKNADKDDILDCLTGDCGGLH